MRKFVQTISPRSEAAKVLSSRSTQSIESGPDDAGSEKQKKKGNGTEPRNFYFAIMWNSDSKDPLDYVHIRGTLNSNRKPRLKLYSIVVTCQ